MKNINQLTRNNIQITYLCRAKRAGVNMMARKEYRRATNINYFAKDYTNQQNSNAWFNAKKLKAAVHHYQEMRNMHRGTNPISPQLKKQMAEKFTADSHWQYWNYRNFMKQQLQERQMLEQINLEAQIASLPAKLREQVQKLQAGPLPEMIRPNFHFSEQYQVCLPSDQKYRRNLILRLQNPPKDRSMQEQED